MVEVAFEVVYESALYNRYFQAMAEKQKFHEAARSFFEKHGLVDNLGYYQEEYLALQLTDEQREKFADQLKKLVDNNNVSYFKKNSVMYKEWTADVVSKVDMKIINQMQWWYFPYIGTGHYSLWDHQGQLYGYLQDNNKDSIQLTDEMIRIPLSEYHRVKEEKTNNV